MFTVASITRQIIDDNTMSFDERLYMLRIAFQFVRTGSHNLVGQMSTTTGTKLDELLAGVEDGYLAAIEADQVPMDAIQWMFQLYAVMLFGSAMWNIAVDKRIASESGPDHGPSKRIIAEHILDVFRGCIEVLQFLDISPGIMLSEILGESSPVN
ncbi:MAG: hypothetical protein QXT45_04755 [Candidatus Bilamarchaeaceae archaeon]